MQSHYQQITRNTRLLVSEVMHAVRHGFTDDQDIALRPMEITQLEQRILMSASPMAVMPDAAAAAAAATDINASDDVTLMNLQSPTEGSDVVSPEQQAAESSVATTPATVQSTVELVVIDPSADDYEQMVADLQANTDRVFEILVLNPRKDGIAQITDILDSLDDVSAIHLVSHGDDGELLLGTSVLSQQSMGQYAAEMITWQNSMTEDADLLIYGCDLAASESGRDLLESLSVLTGADVAGSDDDTGHAKYGGDWDLEFTSGSIESTIAFSSGLQENWMQLLAVPQAVNDGYVVNEDTALDSNDAWFDNNWSFRRTLSFDNSAQSENLTDVPVLVALDASRIDYAQTQDNGEDLRFVDGDGTVLAHEIEEWNEAGTSYVWVKVQQIDGASDTDFIHMYYGNAGAADGQDAVNVWNADHQAVWHLNETSGNNTDSTVNGDDINTFFGGVDQNATGQIGGANDLDGTDDYMSRSGGGTNLGITGDVTLEAWVYMENLPAADWAAIIEFAGSGDTEAENNLYSMAVHADGEVAFGHESGAGNDHFFDTGVILNAGQWYHVTSVRDVSAKDWTLYIDGAQAGPALGYAQNATGGGGSDVNAGWDQGYFDGIVDEIRISSTERSADWVAAQHASGRDTLITYGYQHTVAGVLGNDLDADSDSLTASLVSGPANAASFSLNVDGSFTYTAVADFNGVDSFTYTNNDGSSDSNVATVTITVNAVNDAPVLDNSGSTTVTDIQENDVNNSGDLVSSIIASSGDPITDVDAAAAEGIAVIGVDDLNGTWEYSTNGGGTWTAFGSVSGSSAVVLTDTANDRIRFVPGTGYNGAATFLFRGWDTTDGNTSGTTAVDASSSGGSSSFSSSVETAEISVTAVEVVFSFATVGDVTSSGAPGLDSWTNAEVLNLSDPNLAFEPGTSDGTLSSTINLDTYTILPISIESIHNVSSNITVGGGGNTVNLEKGDVLFSVKENSTTFTGADLVPVFVQKSDLVRFRPGDQTFEVVLDAVTSPYVGGVTLVEKDTLVGDVVLSAGTFLLNVGNTWDVLLFTPTGAGQGVTSGTTQVLIDGADIGMGGGSVNIAGIDLIEDDINPGGTPLLAGQILAILDGSDSDVGNNNITVAAGDIFYLNVTTTTLGTGTTAATATLLVDGGDINLNTAAEEPSAVSLTVEFGVNSLPPVLMLPGAAVNYTENDAATIVDATATATDPDSADFDGGQLRVDFSATGTADDRLAIRHQGVAVGQISVSGNTVSYSGVAIGNFVGGSGGASPLVVTFNANADAAAVQAVMRNITYENVSDAPATVPRTVRFSLTDGDGGTADVKTQIVNVTAVNDSPVITSGSMANVAENQTTVLTVVATDPDTDPVTFALTGGADLAKFSINAATGALVFNTSPNFELATDVDTNNVYEVQVTASDGNGGTHVQLISVTVTDVNEAPLITSGSAVAVAENQTAVLTVTTTDPDLPGDTVTFALTGGADQAKFLINTTTGALTFNTAPDFEIPTDAGTNNVYEVQVTADDGNGGTDVQLISVTVSDVNDAPVITSSSTPAIAENQTAVLTVTATDADLPADTITFSLTGGADQGKFSINASTGNLTFNTAPDFESPTDVGTDNVYEVQVTADDGNGGTDVQLISVSATDVNEVPLITSSATAAVAENLTAVLTVTTTDPDLPGDTVTFALTGGVDQANFSINATTGDLTFNTAPDFETPTDVGTDNVYEVQVTADDGNGGTNVQLLSVSVTAVNDNPPVVTAAQSFNVFENASNGTFLGNVTASDADAGTIFSNWTISGGNTDGIFAINSSTGALTVNDNTNLDCETTGSYMLNMTVSDGLTTSAVQTVNVTVADVSEFSIGAVGDTDAAVDAVDETATPGTVVGVTAFASDPDVTDNVVYSLSVNPGNLFAIDATTGVITTNAVLDAETATSHNVVVLATSDDASTNTLNVTINVNDVNEFAIGVVSDTDGLANAVNENMAAGTTVGVTAFASDPDVGDNVTYTLSVNPGNLFAIDATTGVVTTNAVLDAETAASHSLTVRATSDDGSSSTLNVTIAVTDTNDSIPQVPDQAFTVSVLTGPGQSLGSVNGTDADTSDSLQNWMITSGNTAGIFSINAVTGQLTITDDSAIDLSGTTTFALEVVVSDGVNTAAPGTITVTISPVFVLPPLVPVDDGQSESVSEASEETAADADDSNTEERADNVVAPGYVATAMSKTAGLQENKAPQTQTTADGVVPGIGPTQTESQSESPLLNEIVIDIAKSESVTASTLLDVSTHSGGDLKTVFGQLSTADFVVMTSRHLAASFAATGRTSVGLDNMKRDILAELNFDDAVIGSVATVGSGLTAGYIMWAIRGGLLLSGLLAQMPAWTMIDPLLIVDRLNSEETEGDSLADIVDRQKSRTENSFDGQSIET